MKINFMREMIFVILENEMLWLEEVIEDSQKNIHCRLLGIRWRLLIK